MISGTVKNLTDLVQAPNEEGSPPRTIDAVLVVLRRGESVDGTLTLRAQSLASALELYFALATDSKVLLNMRLWLVDCQ